MKVYAVPSFTIDTSGMLTNAAAMFNSFGPIIFAIIGFSIGIGLLFKLAAQIKGMFT